MNIIPLLLSIFHVATSCKNPCLSLERACECHAVDYCVNSVWKYILPAFSSNIDNGCSELADKLLNLDNDLDLSETFWADLCSTATFEECFEIKHLIYEYSHEIRDLIKAHGKELFCSVLYLNSSRSNVCVKGPEFYCQTFELSRWCNGLKLCYDFDWSRRLRPVVNDSRCESCTKFVKLIHSMHRYRDEFCRSSHKEADCDIYRIAYQNYGSKIAQLMNLENGPDIVCTLMSMCKVDEHWHPDTTHESEHTPFITTPPLVGGEECTWGPGFWCRTVANAEKCGMIPYCKELWKDQSVAFTSDYSESCYSCQLAIALLSHEKNATSLIHGMFNDDMQAVNASRSKSALFRYLMELISLRHNPSDIMPSVLCHHLALCDGDLRAGKAIDVPNTISFAIWRRMIELRKFYSLRETMNIMCKECDTLGFGPNCHQAVFYYTPVFAKLYENGLRSSAAACREVHACNRSFDSMTNSQDVVVPSSPIGCELCVLTIDLAKNLLMDNATEEAVVDFLCQHLCSHLGPLKQRCVDSIHTYDKKIIALIESNVEASDICVTFGMCSNVSAPFTDEFKRFNACTSCLELTSRIQRRSICRIKQFFNIFLNQLCSYLGPLESSCMRTSETLKTKLIKIIVTFFRPERICYAFCSYNLTSIPNDFDNHSRIVDAIAQEMCAEDWCRNIMKRIIQDIIDDLSTECEIEIDNSQSACESCHHLNFDVISMLLNLTRDANVLEEKLIMASTDEESAQFIYDYGAAMSKLLIKGDVQPKEICDALNVCPHKLPEPDGDDEDFCYICKLFSSHLKKAINFNATKEEIEVMLPDVCEMFSIAHEKTMCKEFVFDFAPAIVALIKEKNYTTHQLCGGLHVCQFGLSKVDVGCNICKVVVNSLESLIVSNSSESIIVEKALKTCDKLPAQYQNACVQFVDTYIARVIDLIVTLSSPELVCSELGLCYVQNIIPSSFFCSSCQIAIISSRAWIIQNNVQETLFNYLKFICSMYTNDTYQDCEDSIRAIERVFVKFLVAEDPLKMCEAIHLCPVNVTESGNHYAYDVIDHRLTAQDYEFCSQGIKVWCKNMENAKRCNAVQQCLENHLMNN